MDNQTMADTNRGTVLVRPGTSRTQQQPPIIGIEIAVVLVIGLTILAMVWLSAFSLEAFDGLAVSGASLADRALVTVALLCLASAIFFYRRWQGADTQARQHETTQASWRRLQS